MLKTHAEWKGERKVTAVAAGGTLWRLNVMKSLQNGWRGRCPTNVWMLGMFSKGDFYSNLQNIKLEVQLDRTLEM